MSTVLKEDTIMFNIMDDEDVLMMDIADDEDIVMLGVCYDKLRMEHQMLI